MNAREDYDALADAINFSDITSDEGNANILRRLKEEEDGHFTSLSLCDERDYESENEYRLEGESARSMGWLGYYVGRNTQLKRLLFVHEGFDGILDPFLAGLKDNKNIQEVKFLGCDLRGGDGFARVAPFIEGNVNLTKFEVQDCQIDPEQCRSLSLALGKGKSLTRFKLIDCGVGDEHIGDIMLALSVHPCLKSISITGNGAGRNCCVALSTLMQWRATELRTLCLNRNEIDDERVQVLTNAISDRRGLRKLSLAANPSITMQGWQALSNLLRGPNCTLQELDVGGNEIDDEGAVLFANALKSNSTLKKMILWSNDAITKEGWAAVSKALCDTSSISATFMSNHTLCELRGVPYSKEFRAVRVRNESYLSVNKLNGRKKAALIKILRHHRSIDVEPLFEWEFSALPLVIEWLERTAAISFTEVQAHNNWTWLEWTNGPSNQRVKMRLIGRWKLSAIYQFVRAMPALYIEARLGMVKKNATPGIESETVLG